MLYSPLEVSESVIKFILSIHSVYVLENENIVEPEDISMARKINQTLKIHKLETMYSKWRYLKIKFFKKVNHEDPLNVHFYEGKNEIICGHVVTSESDGECAKCQGSCNEGEEWICCPVTAQKMKFSIKDISSKCDQIRSFLRIWSLLLKKFLMEKFIFCAVSMSSKIP